MEERKQFKLGSVAVKEEDKEDTFSETESSDEVSDAEEEVKGTGEGVDEVKN